MRYSVRHTTPWNTPRSVPQGTLWGAPRATTFILSIEPWDSMGQTTPYPMGIRVIHAIPFGAACSILWGTVGHPMGYNDKPHGTNDTMNHRMPHSTSRPIECTMGYSMRYPRCYTMEVCMPWVPKRHPAEGPMGTSIVRMGHSIGYFMACITSTQYLGMLRVHHGSVYPVDFPIGYPMLYIPAYTME